MESLKCKFLFNVTFLSKIPVARFKLKLSGRLVFSGDLNKASDNRVSTLFSLEFYTILLFCQKKSFILISM